MPSQYFKNFNDFWLNRVQLFGDGPCLIDGEHPEVSYSYRELNDLIDKTAVLLNAYGLKSGDRFGIITRNRPEFFFLYLASLKLGTLIVPIVADSPAETIQHLAQTFNFSLLFSDWPAKPKIPRLKLILLDSLLERLKRLKPDPAIFADTSFARPGSLYFSSGTTGAPKGIPQSPKNLLASAGVLARAYRFGQNDTQMGVMPCYHTALATCGFFPGLMVGSAFVLYERFHRTTFWQNLAASRASFVNIVPTVLSILLKEPEDISGYNLSHLKFIGSASAPMLPALQRQFESKFGVMVSNQHGLSETGALFFNPAEPARRRLGAIGLPTGEPIEIKLIKEDGTETKTNEVGEIITRGPNVIDGYYQNPTETNLAYRAGWFYTGDLAYRDAAGFYFMVGRSKEVINRGGAKILPQEVDNVILAAPGVLEAAAVGVPDPVYGETVIAFVVPKKDHCPLAEEIKQHCAAALPSYKCPREIIFIEEIPQTASGKIFRRQLAARYLEKRS
jgi:acyl-CoA synthetase (AMP-forming)/AMP-acid ligase II